MFKQSTIFLLSFFCMQSIATFGMCDSINIIEMHPIDINNISEEELALYPNQQPEEIEKALINWCKLEYEGFKRDQYKDHKAHPEESIPNELIPNEKLYLHTHNFIYSNDFNILWPLLDSFTQTNPNQIQALINLKNGIEIPDKPTKKILETSQLPTRIADFKKEKLFRSLGYLLDASLQTRSNHNGIWIDLFNPITAEHIRTIFKKTTTPITKKKTHQSY